jgi:hypothetical protein
VTRRSRHVNNVTREVFHVGDTRRISNGGHSRRRPSTRSHRRDQNEVWSTSTSTSMGFGIWDCTDGLQIQSHQTKLRRLLQQQAPSPIPQLQLQVPKSKLKMSQCKSPSSMRRRRPLHPFPPRIMASQTYRSITLLYSI